MEDGTTAGSEPATLGALGFEGSGFDADAPWEEVSEEELLDFLAADLDPVPADPVFRDALRDTLWEMVADGRVARRSDH